jgi:hypothetical protein
LQISALQWHLSLSVISRALIRTHLTVTKASLAIIQATLAQRCGRRRPVTLLADQHIHQAERA